MLVDGKELAQGHIRGIYYLGKLICSKSSLACFEAQCFFYSPYCSLADASALWPWTFGKQTSSKTRENKQIYTVR